MDKKLVFSGTLALSGIAAIAYSGYCEFYGSTNFQTFTDAWGIPATGLGTLLSAYYMHKRNYRI